MNMRRDGKVNWWLLVAAGFLVVNALGVAYVMRLAHQSRHKAAVVVTFEPGNGAGVAQREMLTWSFGVPVAPKDRVGVWTTEGPVAFDPPARGRFCWADAQHLAFEPTEPWADCTEYTALLSLEPMRTPADRAAAQRFMFHTAPLRLIDVVNKSLSPSREATFVCEFSSKVDPQRFRDFVSIESESGKIGYEVVGAATRHVLVKTAPVLHDKMQVRFQKGLPPQSGTLALADGSTHELELTRTLRMNRMQGESEAFGPSAIDIELSLQVPIGKLAPFIMIEPKCDFTVDQYQGYSREGCTLRGEFTPGSSYQVTLLPGLPAENDSVLATNVTRTVYIPERPASIKFQDDGSYLSSHGSQLVAIDCVNTKKFTVRAERIFPNNLVYFATRSSGYYYGGRASDISETTATRTYELPVAQNVATQAYVHMEDMMGGKKSGAFSLTASDEKSGSSEHLVIVTDIGIMLKRSAGDVLVWANSLRTLEPVAGASVKVFSRLNQVLAQGTTEASGLARLTGDFATNTTMPYVVIVESGDDISYLAVDKCAVTGLENIEGLPYVAKGCEAYVFTDRGVYRPGESVHAEAVVRDRVLACPQPFPVNLRVTGPDGRVYRTLNGMLSEFGAVTFELPLPVHARTGRYQLDATVPGTDVAMGSTTVMLEDFVPPQIAVKLKTDETRATNDFTFAASAHYLFGRPAAGLKASAEIAYRAVPFAHAKWPDYIFADDERKWSMSSKNLGSIELDTNGTAKFTACVDAGWRPPSAVRLELSATVTEPSGRAVTTYADREVDVYPFYLGLKAAKEGMMAACQPHRIDLAAVQPDGTARAGTLSVHITLNRVNWSYALKRQGDGSYHYESTRTLTPVAESNTVLETGKASYTCTPPHAGQFLLNIAETNTGVSASMEFYAGLAGDEWRSWSMEKPGRIDLSLDKKTYTAGETATLLVKAPFAGKLLFTIETDRVLDARVISITGNTTQITVPVTEAFAPNAYCSVSVIRPVAAGSETAPHRAVGIVPLVVARPEKKYEVSIEAPVRMLPQTSITVFVQVGDGSNGALAEVALAAVDEGICTLTGFKAPDPLKHFESQRRLGVDWFDVYSLLMREISNNVARTPSTPGGDGDGGAVDEAIKARLNPIDAKRFKPVALWFSGIRTDARGRAAITINVPEFSGSLRLMAVAVGKERIGAAKSAVIVKRDVVVKSSMPRFLAPGDQCTMPINVFNEATNEMRVTIGLRATGPLALSWVTNEVVIAQGGSCSLAAQATAQQTAGVATVTLEVRGGGVAFEDSFEIAVRPPAPLTTKADCGSIVPGAVVTLALPGEWLASTARNTVWCSGLPGITLSGGLEYLLNYPYGCLEQTTSSAFPLLYLADLAAVTRPGSMTREDTAQYVQAGIYRVLSMQQYDGGFSYWPHCNERWQWGSVYATHFLVEASKAGYEVPKDQLDSALGYLERLGQNSSDAGSGPSWHYETLGNTYAAYVLARAGRQIESQLVRLIEQTDALNSPARAYLAGALAASGKRPDAARLLRSIGVDAVAAAPRELGDGLTSNARTIALMLMVWLETDPQAAEVPVLAKRLESFRSNGCWYTTQENAMSLLALGKYAQLLQKEKKPFAATVSWNGGKETNAINESRDWRFEPVFAGATEVTITNAGPGTVYFGWQSRGVPASGTAEEKDQQMRIRRELLDVSGAAIGGATLAQGQLAVVRLMIDSGNTAVRNVIIEDLLPAGLEIENPNLKTSKLVSWLPEKQSLNVQHVEMRDDRIIAFAENMSGSNFFFYAVRAVTPGTYVYPPASAECMYDASIRSVNGKTTLTVK